MPTVTAQKLVKAPLKLAWRAFTNATDMRYWLCDFATAEPRPRGRLYLWWNGDFYSSGEYREINENKKLSFLWHSRNETQPTLVTVIFTEQAEGVLVTMEHTTPDEPTWDKIAEGFRSNWEWTLEALAFLLETGMDYRIVNRPMLGIYPGDFTAEQAQKLGVPVTDGMRLEGVVEGMGAQKAGLQRNDVIVSMAGKPISSDFSSLPTAIAGKKGGDVVEVTYYRGAEKTSIQMELSRRPMPQVPATLPELVEQARGVFGKALADLETCFEGVSDTQANARPAAGEWSALETVAHLVQNERGNRIYVDDVIGGYERWTDGFGGNIQAHISATVQIYPTIRAMLDEMRRNVDENLAFLAALPPETVADKSAYYRVGSLFVQGDIHIRAHIEQIQKAIATAKQE